MYRIRATDAFNSSRHLLEYWDWILATFWNIETFSETEFWPDSGILRLLVRLNFGHILEFGDF